MIDVVPLTVTNDCARRYLVANQFARGHHAGHGGSRALSASVKSIGPFSAVPKQAPA